MTTENAWTEIISEASDPLHPEQAPPESTRLLIDGGDCDGEQVAWFWAGCFREDGGPTAYPARWKLALD